MQWYVLGRQTKEYQWKLNITSKSLVMILKMPQYWNQEPLNKSLEKGYNKVLITVFFIYRFLQRSLEHSFKIGSRNVCFRTTNQSTRFLRGSLLVTICLFRMLRNRLNLIQTKYSVRYFKLTKKIYTTHVIYVFFTNMIVKSIRNSLYILLVYTIFQLLFLLSLWNYNLNKCRLYRIVV